MQILMLTTSVHRFCTHQCVLSFETDRRRAMEPKRTHWTIPHVPPWLPVWSSPGVIVDLLCSQCSSVVENALSRTPAQQSGPLMPCSIERTRSSLSLVAAKSFGPSRHQSDRAMLAHLTQVLFDSSLYRGRSVINLASGDPVRLVMLLLFCCSGARRSVFTNQST